MMDESLSLNDLKFDSNDCVVTVGLVEFVGGNPRPPRWGSPAGNSINNRMGEEIRDEANSVTVTHLPTSISVSEHRFTPKRNKELAMAQVESLVNYYLDHLREKARG